jgi:hypothetical protein
VVVVVVSSVVVVVDSVVLVLVPTVVVVDDSVVVLPPEVSDVVVDDPVVVVRALVVEVVLVPCGPPFESDRLVVDVAGDTYVMVMSRAAPLPVASVATTWRWLIPGTRVAVTAHVPSFATITARGPIAIAVPSGAVPDTVTIADATTAPSPGETTANLTGDPLGVVTGVPRCGAGVVISCTPPRGALAMRTANKAATTTRPASPARANQVW